MKIQVDIRDVPMRYVGQMARERHRDGGRADAAARADKTDGPACAHGGGRVARRQRALQEADRQRLEKIILDTGIDQAAIKVDVIAVSDHHYGDRWLADVGKARDIA